MFKEQLGTTVVHYVNEIHINRARGLLLASDKTCTQICLDKGFRSQGYFNRVFKSATSLSPTHFRKANRR